VAVAQESTVCAVFWLIVTASALVQILAVVAGANATLATVKLFKLLVPAGSK
jgi:hypothetical protein